MTSADFVGVSRRLRDKAYDPEWVAAFATKLDLDPNLVEHAEINAEEDALRITHPGIAEIEFDFAAICGGAAHCISAVASLVIADGKMTVSLARFVELEPEPCPAGHAIEAEE